MDSQTPDRRPLIAILLCALLWAVWMQISTSRQLRYRQAQEEARKQAVAEAAIAARVAGTAGQAVAAGPSGAGTGPGATASPGGSGAPPTPPTPAAAPETTSELSNRVLSLVVSSRGARPIAADLREYREAVGRAKEAEQVHLVHPSIDGTDRFVPLAPWFGDATASKIRADSPFETVAADTGRATFRFVGADGLELVRTYESTGSDYLVTVTEAWSNRGTQPITGRFGVVWAANLKGKEAGPAGELTTAAGVAERGISKNPKKPGEPLVYSGLVDWVAVEDRYFVAAAVPVEPRYDQTDAVRFFRPSPEAVAALALGAETTLAPGETRTQTLKLYLGPKDYTVLRAAGHHLDRTIAWGGVVAPITKGLWHALRWLHGWVKNWGVAIIVLTFIIRGLMAPLAAKQMKMANEFSAKSAKLKPQLDRLREKYKDDAMAMNRETMLLYKQHGLSPFSPLAGCLPILVQMPIWWALYRVLYTSIDLRQAPFALWIQDLSTPDPYKVLPVLLGAVTFVQMKLTPNTGADPAQQKMMLYMMPVMFTVMMLNLPSGLVLYIFTSTLMGIAQQWYLKREMPPTEGPRPVPARGET